MTRRITTTSSCTASCGKRGLRRRSAATTASCTNCRRPNITSRLPGRPSRRATWQVALRKRRKRLSRCCDGIQHRRVARAQPGADGAVITQRKGAASRRPLRSSILARQQNGLVAEIRADLVERRIACPHCSGGLRCVIPPEPSCPQHEQRVAAKVTPKGRNEVERRACAVDAASTLLGWRAWTSAAAPRVSDGSPPGRNPCLPGFGSRRRGPARETPRGSGVTRHAIHNPRSRPFSATNDGPSDRGGDQNRARRRTRNSLRPDIVSWRDTGAAWTAQRFSNTGGRRLAYG